MPSRTRRRIDPVARAGDRDQAGQEAIDGQREVPFLSFEVRVDKRSQTGGARSHRGVKRDAANALCIQRRKGAARIEAIPAEPEDQTAGRADNEIVRFHGGPPSRLNTRPSRGPSAIAPASEIAPPIVCTTVEPAKSWKIGPMFASQPSGPHAQ